MMMLSLMFLASSVLVVLIAAPTNAINMMHCDESVFTSRLDREYVSEHLYCKYLVKSRNTGGH